MCIQSFIKGAALAVAIASITGTVYAADYSAGATLGSSGVGVSVSKKTDWHFIEGDQVQLRGTIAGLSTDKKDTDIDISGVDYDADLDLSSLQLGVDWYPFANSVFFSGGLLSSDLELNGTSRNNKAYNVGGVNVLPSDNVSLNLDVDQSSVSPYISVGWGNRIRDNAGFAFHAELGLASSSGADVTLTATDPNNVLSAANIERERKELEDDFDGILAFANIGVSYHF